MTETTDNGILELVRRAVGIDHVNAMRPRVAELCDVSIGRLFIAYARDLECQPFMTPLAKDATAEQTVRRWHDHMRSFIHAHNMHMVEVIDWLIRAHDERHPWLLNVDELGRPRKLMKVHSMAALYAESVKCMARLPSLTKLAPDHQLGEHDERRVCDIPGGYTIVELLTPEALDEESYRMQHCIGHGGYDDKLIGQHGYNLYSVRLDGQPVATIETSDREVDGVRYKQVRQFLGRRNAIPEYYVVAAVNNAMPSLRWLYPPKTKSRVEFLVDDVEQIAAAPRL